MCINMKEMYLCKHPKHMYRDMIIRTRQYDEYCQYEKEYAFFINSKYIQRFQDVQRVYVPCGKCFTCLSKRAKGWTLRLTTEYQKYNNNCVLTLTYNDDNLPEDGLIKYRDVQLFIKRLRKSLPKEQKIRFACCCEYGSKHLRPHYHIIIFNYFPGDINIMKPYKITAKRSKLYKSESLNKLWNKGFVDVGLVDHKTSRYVCQYCVKKAKHKNWNKYQEKIKLSREKLVCSVGTGIEYFKKNFIAIFNNMFCVLGNYKYPIPKYFKNKLKEFYPELFEQYKIKCKEKLKDFELTIDVQRRFEAVEFRYKRLFEVFHT